MGDAGKLAVDFTERQAAMENLAWCAANGVHAVVGTTGFTAADLESAAGLFPAAGVRT